MMYDTLMQMGRWFGYRPGYQDLCRVWMPEEAQGWYEHISESIEELRGEFRSMEASNATPEQFGLKVRSHPDTLIVTARNKMGSGVRLIVQIGLACKLIETHILLRDEQSIVINRGAAKRLAQRIKELGPPIGIAKREDTGWLYRGVTVDLILDFLNEFQNHEGSMLTSGDPVRRYIEERMNTELAKWDVLMVSVRSEDRNADTSLGVEIRRQRRREGVRSDPKTLLIGTRRRVAAEGIEKTGLRKAQLRRAEEIYNDSLKREGRPARDGSRECPDWAYRRTRTRALLMVHLIDIEARDSGESMVQPVVAWGISFPATGKEERRAEYVVNDTWLRENFGEDTDEDDIGGNDE